MSVRPKRSIHTQLLQLSLLIVAVSSVLSLACALYLTLSSEKKALDRNLINSASILSQSPLLLQALEGQASQEELADFLDAATAHTSDIDLILVGDRDNVLYYAPDPDLRGTAYTGDAQNQALAGEGPYTFNETGPMSSDHSAYAPIRNREGEVVGFVVVGIYLRSMAQVALLTILQVVALSLLAMAVAVLLSQRLSRRIKNALQGYEPEAFAQRFHQREDILDALEEGVLAIDREEKIIFFNTAAARLLSLPPDAVGKPLREVYPVSTLGRILNTGKPEYNVSMKSLPDVRVLSDRLPIWENGQIAGAVGIFRNRTEVTRLADDLTGVRHMVDAMRAYTHEFMNKLHVILGLLQIGQTERAQQYIMDTTRIQQEAVSRIMHQIQEPSVAALLVGKTSRANELGIRLTLDRESCLTAENPCLPPEACVTILGNLVENAIESLNQSRCGVKEVSVSIREESSGLLLCVEDTGPGISAALQKTLFQPGSTTKGQGRGTGLSLVREVVDAYEGKIRVESESGVGTSFFVSFRQEPRPGRVQEKED